MMTLMDDYFRIDSRTAEGDETLFRITLLPDCRVYDGHFPGNPVSPGVCNIQMIKECAELLAGGRLFLGYIDKCRMLAVVTPHVAPHLLVRMQLAGGTAGLYRVRATVCDDATAYIEFKGELTLAK